MKSSSRPSLSLSNKYFREKKYFDSLAELTLFQDFASVPFSKVRIQDTINENLNRLITVASRSEYRNKLKEDTLTSLDIIQHERFDSYFKKLNPQDIITIARDSSLKVKVKKCEIESCDCHSAVGWIACNEYISDKREKPLFILEYGDFSYQVNISLTLRDEITELIGLPSYQFIIDFTPFFPPFSSICKKTLNLLPKSAKLLVLSGGTDKTLDLDLTIKNTHSSSKSSILFASHDLRNAGAQNSLLQMVERLSISTDFKMIIISPVDGPMREEYKHSKLNFLIDNDFRFPVKSPYLFISRLYSQIFKLFTLNPRLVVANTFHTSLTSLAATCLNIPTILIPRESEEPFYLFRNLPQAIRKYFLLIPILADKCIFVSKYTRQKWLAWNTPFLSDKYLVINNGLDISKLYSKTLSMSTSQARELLGIPLQASVALTVGTVTERKGQFDTIKSFVEYINKFPGQNAYLMIIGLEVNDYSKSINEYVRSLSPDTKKYIRIFEATQSPSDNLCTIAYKASDVFIMSSKVESYPRVVLEAISYGLGVISTPCFGVKEMLRRDEAIFYESGDINELSRIFSEIFSNSELINALKNSSFQAFRRLETLETMTKKYQQVIQKFFIK